MSPLARLTLGAIQSVNSTSFTSRPWARASSTATSSGGTKAAVVPSLSGSSAWAREPARSRPRAAAPRMKLNGVKLLRVLRMARFLFFGLRSGLPPAGGGMGSGQARALAEQLVAQGAVCVGGLVAAAVLQLGHYQVDEVGVAFRGDRAGQVEAVQTGFVDPRQQLVGHLRRRADRLRVAPAQGVLLQQAALGPAAEALDHRLDGIGLALDDGLVQAEGGQVDAGGGGEVGDAGLGAGMALVLGQFVAGLGLARRDDHADTHEHLDRIRGAASGHGRGTYLVDLGAHRLLVLPADEHALGVVAGELQAAR